MAWQTITHGAFGMIFVGQPLLVKVSLNFLPLYTVNDQVKYFLPENLMVCRDIEHSKETSQKSLAEIFEILLRFEIQLERSTI